MRRRALEDPQQSRLAAKDSCQCAAHGGDSSHWPELIEHYPDDQQSDQDSNQAVSRRSQFGGRAEALERHEIKRKCDLKSRIAELPSCCPPGGDKRDTCDQHHERKDRI